MKRSLHEVHEMNTLCYFTMFHLRISSTVSITFDIVILHYIRLKNEILSDTKLNLHEGQI
jgi:hypothetical protein